MLRCQQLNLQDLHYLSSQVTTSSCQPGRRLEKSLPSSSGHGALTRLGERELAWSEGRHAGASERLFEGLPDWQESIIITLSNAGNKKPALQIQLQCGFKDTANYLKLYRSCNSRNRVFIIKDLFCGRKVRQHIRVSEQPLERFCRWRAGLYVHHYYPASPFPEQFSAL